MTVESTLRPLTQAERRLLKVKIREIDARLERRNRPLLPGVAIVAVLWVLTLVVSDASWPIVTAFWIVIGAAILVWVRRDLARDLDVLRDISRVYESALSRNEAEEFRFTSTSYAEFEEYEDEGACYAFQIAPNRLAFVVGQEFYPQARFPSHDFSLVYPLDERGGSADMFIEKRGDRAAPARTIPAETKLALAIPEHLEVRVGRIERLEEALGTSREEV